MWGMKGVLTMLFALTFLGNRKIRPWKIRPGKFTPEEISPPENSPPYRVIQYSIIVCHKFSHNWIGIFIMCT